MESGYEVAALNREVVKWSDYLMLQYQPDVVSHLEGFDLARELPETHVDVVLTSLLFGDLQQHVDEEAEAFMRLLTYPEIEAPVKNSTVGIASHTDFECFTIIHQNGEGLHLLNRKGDWVEAPVCDDRLFVMVGDMLEHWTNGVLVATEHRVCNSEKKRQSIVRFNGANGNTVVEPLPAFVTPDNPPRYARMTQREHITNQIELAEQLLQKTKAAAHA
ncbi:hypothetical protein ON010_g10067 [Phytophthora cinnamomi]|nr:hypothetical protein ON010_g10067 [Phytophthora cinnamomi]